MIDLKEFVETYNYRSGNNVANVFTKINKVDLVQVFMRTGTLQTFSYQLFVRSVDDTRTVR